MKTFAILASCLLAACYSEQNLGFTAIGSPRWAIALGGLHDDAAGPVAIDSLGDVIVAGYFNGPADFGSGPVAAGGPWSFITKRVASDGAERWTALLLGRSSTSSAGITDIAVDHEDNVIVTGGYYGTVDFGGQTLALPQPSPPATGDMFVAKYAPDGTLLWVHGLASDVVIAGEAVAIDGADRIFVASRFARGSVEIAGRTFSNHEVDAEGLLVAFDPDGTPRWGQAFDAPDDSGGPLPTSIAVAPNGDVLAAGVFTAPSTFGGATIDPGARIRGFVARFRNDGLYLWSRAIGAAAPQTSGDAQMVVDPTGQVLVMTTDTDVDFPSAPDHATLHALDGMGDERWSAQIPNRGGSSPQQRTLATTPDGLALTGAWDDAPYGASVNGHMEVTSYDSTGRASTGYFGDRAAMGATAQTFPWAAAVGPSGAVAFSGQFGGTLEFGAATIETHGPWHADAFVVLVNPPPRD